MIPSILRRRSDSWRARLEDDCFVSISRGIQAAMSAAVGRCSLLASGSNSEGAMELIEAYVRL